MKKRILLGVSGGIAAYKGITLTSLLVKAGYDVHVIMTKSATKFVTPLTFQTISRNYVHTDTFEERNPEVVSHIDLADLADLVVVAPATANIIGKLANGIADDMLSTTLIATTAPVVIAPAMNIHMYIHPAVTENIAKLQNWGYSFIEPNDGPLACGYTGKGRLQEPEVILQWIEDFFNNKKTENWITQDFSGKTVLITSGPTQEPIDPVRYLTNHSSGKMGLSLAIAAQERGAKVLYVTGPTKQNIPYGIDVYPVVTALEMKEQVINLAPQADWIIGAAAVADYRPKVIHEQKLKKNSETMTIELEKNPDIMELVGQQKKQEQVLVGFAAETENMITNATKKITKKNLDYIIANDVSEDGSGFNSDTNRVTIMNRNGNEIPLPKMTKEQLAHKIFDALLKDLGEVK